jgi:hypothetical protein
MFKVRAFGVICLSGTQPQNGRQVQGGARQFLDFGCRVNA